jgi:hypothetical protein
MKTKLFFTILCAIELCISMACSGAFDATTDATSDTRTAFTEKNLDTGVDES